MGVRWDALPRGLGEKLPRTAAIAMPKILTSRILLIVYWRLIRWGCVGMLCPEALLKSCGQQLIAMSKILMRRILPIVYWRLTRWVCVGSICLEALAKSCAVVDRNVKNFNAQNIANSLLALDQMGVRWDALPVDLGEKLWAVERNAKTFNAQEIANSLLALDQMGCVGMLCL